MASKVATYKRLLTTNCNKIDRIISAYKEDKIHEIPLGPNVSQELQLENVQRLQEAITAIEIVTNKLERTLFEFASTMDDESLHQGKEAEEFETYSNRIDSALSGAFDFAVLLHAKLRVLTSTPVTAPPQDTASPSPVNQPRAKTIELPPVPVPIFEGNIWEWDNFWGIFQTNIHSQDLPEMVKFNYLLNSLKGEAKESIKKFQVTANNYSKAVNFLLNKYNNREALINNLIERLDTCVLRTPSVKDQRTLLENLQAIVVQLQEKQEDVNSSWLIKKVLTKFPDSTKRKVLSKRQGQLTETAFTMQNLFKFIEEVLSNEELILQFTDKKSSPHPGYLSFSSKKSRFTKPLKRNCMYCGNDHSSNSCTKYATPQDRSQYLRQNRLCLICASSQHKTVDCKGHLCFKCEGAHHSSCCFSTKGKSAPQIRNSDAHSNKRDSGEMKRGNSRTTGSRHKGSEPKVRSHVITSETSSDSASAAQPILHTQLSSRSCLPTGEVTVLDPHSKTLVKVDVLIDTGAELSFVDESLAQKLSLPVLQERKIRINTFGTNEVKERLCKLVRMELWDDDGTPHSLDLLTYKTLTQPFSYPQLSIQDHQYLKTLNLSISLKNKGTINPLILLGCDLLWSFIRTDTPPVRLPSGLNLMLSKLGPLLSGKSRISPAVVAHVPQDPEDNIDLWDSLWSMNTVQSICLTSSSESEVSQEERDEWERYWAMDATGAEEFQGAERIAQDALDKKVWEDFNSTIERREDGYYVRLPWKEQHPLLPDNKALAYRRLNSVWAYLKKDEELLDQYHNIFQDQLCKNIVEIVDENEAEEQFQIHYIPHQPVLTPHKTTTKLRIVFDASAHYKGCPSLNDVLHRGPVILPRLHGLLLRFRIGAIALTADVEKAFLQVRLHEADRNATRCLWLQDHKKPPTADNLQTLRFTRVTFGLKSSPFLLAGTTHYHLDGYSQEPLAQEIKNNLYVDNLLLTTDSFDESIQYYRKSKRIFEDLNMNLREFTSNSQEVMKAIREPDKAIIPSPKVLGVQWNTASDVLTLSCSIPDVCPITKRTITSAIATVYDPMGWYVPLIHRARVFLQNLWKEQYDWNSPMSATKANEWHQIRTQADGFHKTLPRFLTLKNSTVILASFSDASSSGMAACTYLCQNTGANLLMARSKLPAIHGKTTIPKLELNAITLATRLSNFVISHLESVLCIQGIYLLCDSEIVLGWLKSKPNREVGVFVYNRLTEIRRIATSLIENGHFVKFGYVVSEENPADCGTRGLTKEELSDHCWWTGPRWIQDIASASWPHRSRVFDFPEDVDGDEPIKDETRRIFATTKSRRVLYDPELIQDGHVNTFTKAKRIVAYALRFLRALITRCRTRNKNKFILSEVPDVPPRPYSPYLCASEMEIAAKTIIKTHQRLRVTKVITDSLKNLNIHQDENGILRCYGRLGRAQLDFNAKYPILVLQKTLLAKIIIQECHERGHPGINHTISLVRQEFWIPQLRAQVQQTIRKCVRCQKFNNLPYKYPAQDDLPKERVVRSRPFQHVGLDYFGPSTVTCEGGETWEMLWIHNYLYGDTLTAS